MLKVVHLTLYYLPPIFSIHDIPWQYTIHTLRRRPPPTPCEEALGGGVCSGMFVCLCSASKKPSEREFFVPARTDLAVLLSTFSRRHSQKSFVVDVRLLVNLLVESTRRKSHTAHLRFLNQYWSWSLVHCIKRTVIFLSFQMTSCLWA